MRRTSPTLRLAQFASRASLRQAKHPEAAFDAIYQRLHRAEPDAPPITDEYVLAGHLTHLRAYAQTPGLSGVGWAIAKSATAHRLGNRLRIARLHAQHPDLAHVPIRRPVFVVGLPRTGTTLTHNVLATATGARGPRLWEMFDLALPDQRSRREIDHVKRGVGKQLGHFLKLSPDWNLIHPMDPEAIEEDTFLKSHSVMDLGTAPMPGYWEYLTTEGTYDPVEDFTTLKRALQILSWRQPERRWVLKHPGNLYYLEAILAVFPDAKIVWTHRDPADVFGSMCSMAWSLHHLHLEPWAVDPKAIARRWLDLLAYGIETARTQRVHLTGGIAPTMDPKAFIDVSYAALMAHPEVHVAELFDKLDLPWGANEEHALRAALRRPRDGRRHEHPLGQFGMDSFSVADTFGDYMSMLRRLDARAQR
jgi:hypothetical protein